MTPDRFVRTSRRGGAGRGRGPSSQRPAVDASIKKISYLRHTESLRPPPCRRVKAASPALAGLAVP